jgi:cephalosporin hydroxylase
MADRVAETVDDNWHVVVNELGRALRQGSLDSDQRAELLPLVGAYLKGVDQDAPLPTVIAVCSAFERLFQPRGQPVSAPPEPITGTITDAFHRLYYSVSRRTWKDTWYRGILTYKCPTDMWVYQELIDQLRPSLVIETGTFRGGSALFLADRLETIGHGEIITIDIDAQPNRPEHTRLTYLTGSSVGPDVLAHVQARIPDDGHVLVILDADHHHAHVAAELRAYAPLVTIGSYLIVEDTNINGHPTEPDYGPGPWEATREFLAGDDRFEVDERCERYFLTQNPGGYLRKVR